MQLSKHNYKNLFIITGLKASLNDLSDNSKITFRGTAVTPSKIATCDSSYYLSNFTQSGNSYYHDFVFDVTNFAEVPMISAFISETTSPIPFTLSGISKTGCRVWISSKPANAIINIWCLGRLL